MRKIYRRHRTGLVLLATVFASQTLLSGCSGSTGDAAPETLDKRRPLVTLLIKNGGFEADSAWTRSAPPGYARYADIDFDRRYAATGKRSGRISIRRHPGAGEEKILHAWSQKLLPGAAGHTVRFGGWVRVRGAPEVHLAVEYEPVIPLAGEKVVAEKITIDPLPRAAFRLFQKRVHIPAGARNIVFYAGLSSIGDVWFDNLFAFIDTTHAQQ